MSSDVLYLISNTLVPVGSFTINTLMLLYIRILCLTLTTWQNKQTSNIGFSEELYYHKTQNSAPQIVGNVRNVVMLWSNLCCSKSQES